jgi:hypothetical protein
MLRSRKRHSATSPDDNEKGLKNSRNATTKKNKPLVPTWALFFTVLLFIFLGFASEQYKKSRGVDPFEGRHLILQNAGHTWGKSLLSEEEDSNLEYHDGQRYHVIFSTDCSPYQHWQR